MEFTGQERAVLKAVIDRILPPDEDPGAWDAGAEDYLARQLDGELAAMREPMKAGLAALDAEAQRRSALPFAALPAAAQDVVLREIETTDFFLVLVRTTAEGFYTGAVSWRMTGFERDPA